MLLRDDTLPILSSYSYTLALLWHTRAVVRVVNPVLRSLEDFFAMRSSQHYRLDRVQGNTDDIAVYAAE